MKTALVLGGARCVWADAEAALILADKFDLVVAINDMIVRWPEPITHAVSLHPEKLGKWVADRARAGLSARGDFEIWSHRHGGPHLGSFYKGVEHVTPEWGGGSSGLLAVKVAMECGAERIVLAGVPMDPAGGNVVRGDAPWRAALSYRIGWTRHHEKFAAYTRSMSGWTRERLGSPTPEWLGQRRVTRKQKEGRDAQTKGGAGHRRRPRREPKRVLRGEGRKVLPAH